MSQFRCLFRIFSVLLAALCFIISGCQRGAGEDPAVAKVAGVTIPKSAFREAYKEFLLDPRHFDTEENRRFFLQQMVDQKLLASMGREQGLDQDSTLRRLALSFRDKITREMYLDTHIYPRAGFVTETEAREVFGYLNEERLVRHLFAPTQEGADSLLALLEAGKEFEELSQFVFSDSTLRSTGGPLGWVRFNQMDYNLATGLFQAKPGKATGPIQSAYGYHIIRVDNIRKNPLVSEHEFERYRAKTNALIRSAKIDRMLGDWVREMMGSLKIRENGPLLETVSEEILKRLNPYSEKLPQKMQLSEQEHRLIRDPLKTYWKEPIAWVDGEMLTVEDFINGLTWIPFSITSRNVKAALGHVIRDRQVTRLAIQEKVHEDNFVRMKGDLFEEALISRNTRRELIKSIQITQEESHEFYETEILRYRDTPVFWIDEVQTRSLSAARAVRQKMLEEIPSEDLSEEPGVLSVKENTRLMLTDNPDYYQAIATLNPGDVTPVLESGINYAVLRIQRKEDRVHPFDSVHSDIVRDITNRKRLRIVSETLDSLKTLERLHLYPKKLEIIFDWDQKQMETQ